MKIVVISDTHGKHRWMDKLPKGDVLVHCGDFSNVGERDQVDDFLLWMYSQPHKHKVFIAGNHDRSFDHKFHRNDDSHWLEMTKIKAKQEFGLHYLENTAVQLDGINFWGSPMTPDFYPQHWAFNRSRGEVIARYWNEIPQDTDVLITHGPCAHVLDWCMNSNRVGCSDLTYHIQRVQPVYHLFGHIHESYGIEQHVDTTYVNASVLNENYKLVNKPIVVKI